MEVYFENFRKWKYFPWIFKQFWRLSICSKTKLLILEVFLITYYLNHFWKIICIENTTLPTKSTELVGDSFYPAMIRVCRFDGRCTMDRFGFKVIPGGIDDLNRTESTIEPNQPIGFDWFDRRFCSIQLPIQFNNESTDWNSIVERNRISIESLKSG